MPPFRTRGFSIQLLVEKQWALCSACKKKNRVSSWRVYCDELLKFEQK